MTACLSKLTRWWQKVCPNSQDDDSMRCVCQSDFRCTEWIARNSLPRKNGRIRTLDNKKRTDAQKVDYNDGLLSHHWPTNLWNTNDEFGRSNCLEFSKHFSRACRREYSIWATKRWKCFENALWNVGSALQHLVWAHAFMHFSPNHCFSCYRLFVSTISCHSPCGKQHFRDVTTPDWAGT